MWELWSGAQTPYLDLRNQEVKGKVNATCGIEFHIKKNARSKFRVIPPTAVDWPPSGKA